MNLTICVFKLNFLFLFQLKVLNLGNNCFTELPKVIEHMINLIKLHAYKNLLTTIDGTIFCK